MSTWTCWTNDDDPYQKPLSLFPLHAKLMIVVGLRGGSDWVVPSPTISSAWLNSSALHECGQVLLLWQIVHFS